MLHTIIFDIGNVLMTFDYPPYLRRLLGDEALARRVDAAIWGSGLWNELDRGGDPAELFPQMRAAAGDCARAVQSALDHIGDCMARRDYAGPWVEELKARGYRVLFLSNYSHFIMDARPDVLYFLSSMDGGIFSCDVRLVKPDAAIYRLLCERYQLTPSECVFLDDTEANVDAARRLGFQTVQFSDYAQGRAALEALLTEEVGG